MNIQKIPEVGSKWKNKITDVSFFVTTTYEFGDPPIRFVEAEQENIGSGIQVNIDEWYRTMELIHGA